MFFYWVCLVMLDFKILVRKKGGEEVVCCLVLFIKGKFFLSLIFKFRCLFEIWMGFFMVGMYIDFYC